MNNDGNDTVVIKNLKLYRDEKILENDGFSFSGHKFSKEEIASEIIRGYLNENGEIYQTIACDILKTAKEKLSGKSFFFSSYKVATGMDSTCTLARKIFKKYIAERGILQLQMVDSNFCSYYSDGDSCVLIRNDGSVATDIDAFYENAFAEAIEEGNWNYLDPKIEKYVKKYNN